jgi:glyoxylate reductase
MRPKVLVTRELPREALERLEEHCDVDLNEEDRPLTREELKRRIRDKDGILSMLTDRIDGELMDAAPNLKVISNYAVGFNNIDVKEATLRGIPVTNTPGVLTESTADLTWALIMDVARRVSEGDRVTRAGRWPGWSPMWMLGRDVHGATLGIVGMGRIGKAVARRARGFDMQVIYYSRTRLSEEEERALRASYRPLPDLLRQADFVCLHAPYSEETHHLIGPAELAMMKSTAYLINTARGPLVDEQALVRALRDGQIAGAGLDVYEREPELAEGLAELDNVVLSPHLGSSTRGTRLRMAKVAVENLLAPLKGKRPPHLVNEEVWRRRRTP